MKEATDNRTVAPWRDRLHQIIFEADTRAGKVFDIALLLSILISVVTVSLESVDDYGNDPFYSRLFFVVEWCVTILFSIEYVLRLVCVRRPLRYAFSFFGIVDILAILPTYLMFFLPGAQSLVLIRALRLLRIFRVFKLARMLQEAATLRRAIWDARGKVAVFVTTVLIAVAIAGSAMYFVENVEAWRGSDQPPSQFTSIPQSMYWAIVTMTTVGYGDIVPTSFPGKMLSALLILVGYSLIIVPTGFVSAELVKSRGPVSTQACPSCMREGHDFDAVYCKRCGAQL